MSSVARHGPPASSRPTVVRPRLLATLQGRFDRRLTVLVAGPGFGKSTLLAQAVDENRLSPTGIDVWYGCTADDAAVSQLASGLLSAVDPAADPATPLTDPRTAAQAVADAIWSRAPAQLALLLDDVHEIPRQSPGHQMLAALVTMLPANGHLVLASRPPSPLPLSRLIAAGDAILLDEEELAFGYAELADFAARRNVPVELLDEVGGWPALAELTASAGRQHVVDYLWEEVLDSIPEERRGLLAILVSVGGADDALMTELLETPTDLRSALDGLPLVAATPEGWWTLHPLWESALSTRAQAPPVLAARRRAAELLRQRGMLRDSMRLLLEMAAWDDVRDLAVEICSGLTPAVHAEVLAHWRDRLPDDVRNSPEGLLLSATAVMGDDPWTAQKLLHQAVKGFRASGQLVAESSCLQSLFHIAFWLNDITSMQQMLTRWDELGRAGDEEAAAIGSLARAVLAADPGQAQRELDAVPRSPSGPLAPLADWLRAHILLLTMGDPDLAATWARQALPRAPATLRSSIRCELVESLRLLGRVDEAELQGTALLDDLSTSLVRSPRHLTVVLVLKAVVGKTADAEGLLPALRSSVDASHLPWAPIAGAVGEAAVAVAAGNEEYAAERLRPLLAERMARPWVLLRVCPAALPLFYLLLPEARADWDKADLRGAFATAHRLARTLVMLREQVGSAPPLEPGDLALAPAYLPVPWTTELCLRLAAAGRPDALDTVSELGVLARPTLRIFEGGDEALVVPHARRMLERVPALPHQRLAVAVLGPLVVSRDGMEVDDSNIRRERVRQLLGFLVVNRSVSRTAAAAALWPDLDEAVAARNLRVTLNYLQGVLEPDRDERDAPFFLRAKGPLLELTDNPALDVDVWCFEQDLQEADRAEHQGAPSVALAACLRAVDRYRGDLLSDLSSDDWSAQERERLRRRYVFAALRAGNLLLARGDQDRPEDLATRALAAEPWSEEAYQLLVATLLARGDRAAARRALDQCFEMLDELGAETSAKTLELVQQLRRGKRPVG